MKKFLAVFASIYLISDFAHSAELNYQVQAKKLDNSRNNLSPKTYSSSYNFQRENIDNLPSGQTSSLNQILLRAPGVSQDSYGQIHIRNDHSNIQYRINDVIIPEGISGFGNVLDARFIDSADLLTGALPAQYGYRTAGVVEIKTKDAVSKDNLKNGFYSEAIYGQNRTAGFNQQASGSKNGLNYFLSGSYLQNSRGLESPTGARKSIHNQTKQDKLFGYFSYLLNANNRVSLIVANSTNRYEIPNTANQKTEFELQNVSNLNSANIDQNQVEGNRFAILSLQGVSKNEIDYQISSFVRHNELKFRGDLINDLVFAGASSNNDKSSLNYGFQGDFSKKINDKNILRAGFYATNNVVAERNSTLTFKGDENGQSSTLPTAFFDNAKKSTQLYSLYLQNEYKPIKDLTLNGGLRFDGVNSAINANHLSPRFNSVYKLNEKIKLHAGYSRFFTAPRAEIMSSLNIHKFEGTVNAPENFNNNRVRPEKTDYYNAGIGFEASKELHFAVDGYYKRVDDMLDEGQFGKALIFKPFNFEKAKIHGIELSADYKIKNLSSFANVAFQRAQALNINSGQYLHENTEVNYSKGNYLNPDHAQNITASAGMAYKFAKTKTNLGFDVLYGSGLRRGEANTLKMPSYSQLNIFAIQNIKDFNFRLSVNNVLDKKYALRDGSGIGVKSAQFAMRRSAYLIISKEF